MKKIIVIGCPGSGKTTFAEKLNKLTGIPLYYLDAIWHKPDKTHIDRESFDRRISEIFDTHQWIIDGNYNRTIELRLNKCDTVFLFDLPTEVCIQGATERLGKGRYDLPWIDTELSPSLRRSIEDFPRSSLPKIYELLEKYKHNREIIVFRSRQDADGYLQSITDKKTRGENRK
ncbi:MAG: adenylate kinase [Clostridia bacterium]|nr:adenylate kinase [Clostridia bacterium]